MSPPSTDDHDAVDDDDSSSSSSNPDNNHNNHLTNTPPTTTLWTATRLDQASYKDLGSPAMVQDRCVAHLWHHCRADLHHLLHSTALSTTTRDYSMPIDAFRLLQVDPVLGFLLIRFPATLLPLLETAMVRAQKELLVLEDAETLDDDGGKDAGGGGGIGTTTNPSSTTNTASTSGTTRKRSVVKGDVPTRLHARLVHLPPTCCKPVLSHMDADAVGKIWQVSGTVVRTGPVQMYESARTYQCKGCKSSSKYGKNGGRGGGGNSNDTNGNNNKQPTCGRTFLVHADLAQRHNALQDPVLCPGTLPNGDRCPANQFQAVEGGSIHTDYQEVKLQDVASLQNTVGHIPRSLLLKVQHDLVDLCQPGDEVVVVGILMAQWQQSSLVEGMDCQVTMAMHAHSVRVIAEHGASAWQSSGGGGGNGGSTTTTTANAHGGNGNGVGELEKFRKEFSQYWHETENVENPIAARDYICRAVCPKLYGMQVVKLALLLTLIGGVSSDAYETDPHEETETHAERSAAGAQHHTVCDDETPDAFQLIPDESACKPSTTVYYGDAPQPSQQRRSPKRDERVKTRRRDQSHILLVGDPGTGKSQFLRFAAALCPRSVLTTGVGTTSAGLTCAAVREGSGKEFSLEAGALVLADKGVCCIDEFGCIRESDRTTIHEAMEQQTLSVAKAGIVCKLNCRATIIAVMNPRACLYDNHASLSVNTGLGTPLLSRFDLIFKLVDSSDAERDNNVTTYLLNRAIQGSGFDVAEPNGLDCQIHKTPWTMEKLRAYIFVVKEKFQPVMSDAAALLLERHYEKCRSTQSNTIPITVRFLESLIRLSQAHARLMHRESNVVDLQDAVAVLQVMECTAFAYGGFDGMDADFAKSMYCDPMSIDFSPEADLDFVCFEYRILERYDMLDYMDKNRRATALADIGPNALGNQGSGINSWQDMENHQMGRTAPAAGMFQWTNSQFTDRWLSQQQPQGTMTQDHYGRIQLCSTSPSHNKRMRR